MRHFDTQATRLGLPLPALIDALRRQFAADCEVPLRHTHAISGGGGSGGTVLIMPAWRVGGRLGIKTVNVFPDNAALGLPAVNASYTLFDARTGVPLALLDGSEITTRRWLRRSWRALTPPGCWWWAAAGWPGWSPPRCRPCVRP